MKGIRVNRLGGPEVLEYTDLPDPIAQAGQVVIDVRGASVNYADIKARSGHYHLGKKPPFIPGIDVAGVIAATGRGVRKLKAGDRVIAFPASGSYAEKALASAELTFKIPAAIGFESAAACPIVAGTSTHMLVYAARLKRGESVLVHAATGGVGSTAIQVAKVLGASRVIASVGSPWKKKHARDFGADVVIDNRSGDYAGEVNRLTDGQGVDVILNPIGGATLAQDFKCLAPFGRLIFFGAMGGEPAAPPLERLHPNNQSMIGFSFGHYRRFRPRLVSKTINRAIRLMAEGQITIHLSNQFPLDKAAEAHTCIETRGALGKVILTP